MSASLAILSRIADRARDPRAVAAREVTASANGVHEVTYANLWDGVQRSSAVLQQRLPAGSTIILVTGNRAAFFTYALAAWHAGCTLFPMHPSVVEKENASAAAKVREFTRLPVLTLTAGLSGDSTLKPWVMSLPRGEHLCADGLSAQARVHGPTSPRHSLRAGLMLQSSGTTGQPKIVYRPASAIDAVARNVAESVGLRRDDRVFAAAPICHAYGIENGFLAPLWAGAAVHLCDGLDVPVALAQFAGPATIFPGVPFMFEVLARQQPGNGEQAACSLRLAYSAGGSLPPEAAQGFANRFGVGVGQLYGASELGSVTYRGPCENPRSVGQPMRGVQVRILDPDAEPPYASDRPPGDEGLVAVAAPSMMETYVGEQPSLIDGCFVTGDLGRVNDHGELEITGRLKHLIDVGGMKVNPAEVEAVLRQYPAIADCIVLPMPLTPTVSRLRAVVVAADGVTLHPEEVRRFARTLLPTHKVPRLVEVRASLPRSPSGKVMRSQLEVGA